MKKIILVVLAAAIMLSGCSRKTMDDPSVLTKDNLKVGFIFNGTINDGGYTKAHNLGRLELERSGILTYYVENVPEDENCLKIIRSLVKHGCHIIYSTSYGYRDYVLQAAKEFPNVKFSQCAGDVLAENVSTYFGRMYEARYLSGIIAGLKTSSNKIGFVAAYPIPECIRGINAFTLGVLSVNPDAHVEVLWTKSWNDPMAEKKLAGELLNNGCDIIAQHQNSTAVQSVAESRGAYCIGYSVRTPKAAPKAYLTAPLFNWGVYIKNDVDRLLEGTWKSRAYWEGLESGIVALDNLTGLCAPGSQKKIEEAETRIISGSLDIFKGPIYDQDDVLCVEEGESLSPEEIWNMSWFVKGVVGSTIDL